MWNERERGVGGICFTNWSSLACNLFWIEPSRVKNVVWSVWPELGKCDQMDWFDLCLYMVNFSGIILFCLTVHMVMSLLIFIHTVNLVWFTVIHPLSLRCFSWVNYGYICCVFDVHCYIIVSLLGLLYYFPLSLSHQAHYYLIDTKSVY